MPTRNSADFPAGRRLERVGVFFSFVLLFAILLLGALEPVNIADEGFCVYNSVRVLKGEVPYRDFFAVYAPGTFFLYAGLFRIFGESLAVSRLGDVLLRGAILVMIYLLARRSASRFVALVPAAVCAFFLATADTVRGYAMWPALVFALLSALLLFRFVDSGNDALLLGTGVCIGLAGFFRHDVGSYTLAATSITFFLCKSNLRLTSTSRFSLLLKYCLILMGAAFVAAPVLLYLIWNGALRDAWYCLVVVPGTILHAARALPFPPLLRLPSERGKIWAMSLWLHSYGPLVVYLLSSILLASRLWKRRTLLLGKGEQALVFTILLGAMLFLQTHRNDFVHRVPTSFFAVLALTISIFEFQPPLGRWFVKSATCGGLLLFFWFYGRRILLPEWSDHIRLLRNNSCIDSLERASCLPVAPDNIEAVRYVQANVAPGEKIFVGLPQHDRVFTGDLMFYFLSGRQSGVRFHEMITSLTNTTAVQKSMRDDLIRSNIRCAVLYSGLEQAREPNLSSVGSGVHILDDYLRSQYKVVAQFGEYTILKK